MRGTPNNPWAFDRALKGVVEGWVCPTEPGSPRPQSPEPHWATASQCWLVLVSAGQCWSVLVSAVGQCWSASAGQCWSGLVSVGQCWSVLVSVLVSVEWHVSNRSAPVVLRFLAPPPPILRDRTKKIKSNFPGLAIFDFLPSSRTFEPSMLDFRSGNSTDIRVSLMQHYNTPPSLGTHGRGGQA